MLALLLGTAQQNPIISFNQSAYIALANPPQLKTASNQPIPPADILLQELTFVRRDRQGTVHFLLNKATLVTSTDPSLFAPKTLRPLTESPELLALRRKYLGKAIWIYGQYGIHQYATQQAKPLACNLTPAHPQRIEHIYELDQSFQPTTAHSPDKTRFIFVFARKNITWADKSTSEPIDSITFSAPFTTYEQLPEFENTFSFTGPTASDLIAVNKYLSMPPSDKPRADQNKLASWGYGDTKADTAKIKGLTHLQVAWALGWPPSDKPRTELLKLTS